MYNLIPNLNVKENVEVGAYLSDDPLDVDEPSRYLGYMSTDISFQISFPVDSSRDIDRQSHREEPIYFCVMSRREHWTTIPPRRYSS